MSFTSGHIGVRWDQGSDRDRERVRSQGLDRVAILNLHAESRHRKAAARRDRQPVLALPLLRLRCQTQRAGGTMLHDLKRPQGLRHFWQCRTYF